MNEAKDLKAKRHDNKKNHSEGGKEKGYELNYPGTLGYEQDNPHTSPF